MFGERTTEEKGRERLSIEGRSDQADEEGETKHEGKE